MVSSVILLLNAPSPMPSHCLQSRSQLFIGLHDLPHPHCLPDLTCHHAPSVPAVLDASLFSKHTRKTPASGLLHSLFPLLGNSCLKCPNELFSHFPLGLYSKVTFSLCFSLAALSQITTHSPPNISSWCFIFLLTIN